jgi:hypothetical protein
MSGTERPVVLAAGSPLLTVSWRTTVLVPSGASPAYVAAPPTPIAAAATRTAAVERVLRRVMAAFLSFGRPHVTACD